MKRQFIVTAPLDYGRHELEMALWNFDHDLSTERVSEIMGENPEIQLWDLQDFVVYCNNQEFDVDSVWMEAITVEVPEDYESNQSTWYNNLIRF